jgi:hypothetical protein
VKPVAVITVGYARPSESGTPRVSTRKSLDDLVGWL